MGPRARLQARQRRDPRAARGGAHTARRHGSPPGRRRARARAHATRGRGSVRNTISRARPHGADELRRRAERPGLRHLDRNPGAEPRAGSRDADHRPAAQPRARAHHVSRRRLRQAAGSRLRRRGSAARAARAPSVRLL
jgi:hypothetical protein